MSNEQRYRDTLDKIKANIGKALVGKGEVIDMVLAAYIAGGHVLIEDVPGLGKTTLVSALAKSVDCSFKRIQFTPDVLPSDVTGYTSFDLKTGEKQVNFGSVMSQIVLADEINRTSPKTQSSLLEVMQENQITIDGVSYAVPQPFIVLATQNPVEQVGTYPLPEAQLDRFLLKVAIGYPSMEDEKAILLRNKGKKPLDELCSVAKAEDIMALRAAHAEVICADPVMDYIVRITDATRHHSSVTLGVSPRGSLALMNAAMARALLSGRNFTLPDDVQAMVKPVLGHRLIMNGGSVTKETPEQVLDKIIRSVKVPSVS
jgi:MoxR-like ATPase